MPVKHVSSKNSINRSIALPVVKKHLVNKKNLYKIAGCLSSQDAEELKAIIEEGCERIEQDAWKNLH